MAQQLPLLDAPDRSDGAADPMRASVVAAAGSRARRRRNGAGGRALAVVVDHPDVIVEIDGPDWRIDEHTKTVGLAGVADARRALAEAVGRSAA